MNGQTRQELRVAVDLARRAVVKPPPSLDSIRSKVRRHEREAEARRGGLGEAGIPDPPHRVRP